jgi:hypothetical protein
MTRCCSTRRQRRQPAPPTLASDVQRDTPTSADIHRTEGQLPNSVLCSSAIIGSLRPEDIASALTSHAGSLISALRMQRTHKPNSRMPTSASSLASEVQLGDTPPVS